MRLPIRLLFGGSGAEPSRPRTRRRLWLLGGLAATVALFFAVYGGVSTVTPPQSPAEPATVFILREARHVGVLLPNGRSGRAAGYVEYGFGDWSWYALGKNRWYHVFGTLFWPSAGALSRREFVAATPDELRAAAPWIELDALVVGGTEVANLRATLEAQFASGRAHAIHRADLRMDFVPAASNFWCGNLCADAAARWLRQLGCQVSWVPIRRSLIAEPRK